MDYEVKADGLEASFDAVEASGVADEVAVLRGEVARLSRVADEAVRAARRPAIGGAGAKSVVDRDPAMAAYLRQGVTSGLETKAATLAFAETTNAGADGGYAVPLQIDTQIQETLRDISPIRRIANVVQVGTSNYRRLVTLSNVQSGWVTDATARVNTNSLQFSTIQPPMAELYANLSATQSMLDDSAFDFEGWLATEVAREFARAEGFGFVRGTGGTAGGTNGMPSGFLNPNTPPSPLPDGTGTGTRPFGTLQYIGTGVAGGFPAQTASVFPQDTILTLIHTLRPAYRQNAKFVMNTQTLLTIRKMKDNYGDYVWQPSITPGQPDTLFGYPVIDAEDMPMMNETSSVGPFAIAFGDFEAGYLIADRFDTRVLRDPYTNKPFVNFLCDQTGERNDR